LKHFYKSKTQNIQKMMDLKRKKQQILMLSNIIIQIVQKIENRIQKIEFRRKRYKNII
jgi:hypothetical protein